MSSISIKKKTKAGKPMRRADGSYIWAADVVHDNGQRESKATFRTKEEARTWAEGALSQSRVGVYVPDAKSITMADACELWIDKADGRLEKSTVKGYKEHAYRHIIPELGAMKLSKIDRGTILSFVDKARKEKSEAMARKLLGSLNAILNTAMDYGKVANNVAAGVRMPKTTKRTKAEIRIPTRDEITTILDAAKVRYTDDRPNQNMRSRRGYYEMLRLAAFTGLRISEIRGLRWDNVDLDTGEVVVRERADAFGDIGDPKSAQGAREVPMGAGLIAALKEWKIAQPPAQRENGLVFPNGKGNPENLQNLYRRFLWPLEEECGLIDKEGEELVPRYGFHAFRHFYASVLISLNHSVVEVQRLMGHASAQMTLDVYGHLFRKREDGRDIGAEMEAAVL